MPVNVKIRKFASLIGLLVKRVLNLYFKIILLTLYTKKMRGIQLLMVT